MKKYILDNFKYRELGENLSRKIKKAAMELDTLFYTIDEEQHRVTVLRVLKDGMNWQYILKQWVRGNR